MLKTKIVLVVLYSISLTACMSVDPRCRTNDYCAYRDPPRQYIRAPDGWGGKYCSANPTKC